MDAVRDQQQGAQRDIGQRVDLVLPPGVSWFIWRPVVEGKASLREIETEYTLVDLWKLNKVMDAVNEAERELAARAERAER